MVWYAGILVFFLSKPFSQSVRSALAKSPVSLPQVATFAGPNLRLCAQVRIYVSKAEMNGANLVLCVECAGPVRTRHKQRWPGGAGPDLVSLLSLLLPMSIQRKLHYTCRKDLPGHVMVVLAGPRPRVSGQRW